MWIEIAHRTLSIHISSTTQLNVQAFCGAFWPAGWHVPKRYFLEFVLKHCLLYILTITGCRPGTTIITSYHQ